MIYIFHNLPSRQISSNAVGFHHGVISSTRESGFHFNLDIPKHKGAKQSTLTLIPLQTQS